MNILKVWKMAILGCNFNINFDQTLAPGSSLCNTLRTKLHAWTESSIIVEFMVKFIWQHNLPVGSYHTFKMPPGRLDFWCSKGKKWDPPVTPKLKVREVSQSGFWNISSHPTSVPSFSQIGWLQLLAPGTLSQTMTLNSTLWEGHMSKPRAKTILSFNIRLNEAILLFQNYFNLRLRGSQHTMLSFSL